MFQLEYEPLPQPGLVPHWAEFGFWEGTCQNELHREDQAHTVITVSIVVDGHPRAINRLLACQRCEGALRHGGRMASIRSGFDAVSTFALD